MATIKQQKDLISKKIVLLRNNKLAWALIQDYLKACNEQNKIIDIQEFYDWLENKFDALTKQ